MIKEKMENKKENAQNIWNKKTKQNKKKLAKKYWH